MPLPTKKHNSKHSAKAAPKGKPLAKKAAPLPVKKTSTKSVAKAAAPAPAKKAVAKAPIKERAAAAAPAKRESSAPPPKQSSSNGRARASFEVSPRGRAVWPRLSTPDEKYNRLGTGIALKADSVAATRFIEKIDEQIEQSYAQAVEAERNPAKRKKITRAAAPYALELDEDGDETGYVIFKFSRQAGGIAKKTGKAWKARVKHFDLRGNLLDPAEDGEVGSGSTIAISFEWNLYCVKGEAGVSLRPQSVMVYELVEYTGGFSSASDYGFEVDESDDDDASDDTDDDEDEQEESEDADDESDDDDEDADEEEGDDF